MWQRASEALWYRDYRATQEAMQPVWTPAPVPVIEPAAVAIGPVTT
jgi:hypothetical protein